MKLESTENLNALIGKVGKVLVITDAPPPSAYDLGEVMSKPAMKLFGKFAKAEGFSAEDFTFVTPCPPVPAEFDTSETKIKKFVLEFADEFNELLAKHVGRAKVILALGKLGNLQHAGKSVKITVARGVFCKRESTGKIPVMPLLSPPHILRRPEMTDIYESDFRQVGALAECGWSVKELHDSSTGKYQWVDDIQHLVDNPPPTLTFDLETVGLKVHQPEFRVLTAAITVKGGKTYVLPLDAEYFSNPALFGERTPPWAEGYGSKQVNRLVGQLKQLLENPKVHVVGHNLKFDIHGMRTLGVHVANWYADTMQLAFLVDENMQSKSLDECVRRWVPSLAGYADAFNKDPVHLGKSRMDLVPHDRMLEYAGGDTDATYELVKVLLEKAKEDKRQWRTFVQVQMPTLRSFVKMEQQGVMVDKDALRALGVVLSKKEAELRASMLQKVPPKVLAKYAGEWHFTRPTFLIDILFSKDGFNLKPLVFTKGSMKEKDIANRIPSVSAKMHLPYFRDNPFVAELIEYIQLQKMRTTYVGLEAAELVEPVKRLKNGSLPKRITEAVSQVQGKLAEQIAAKSTAVRRRRAINLHGVQNGGDTKATTADIQIGNAINLRVDGCGNVSTVKFTENTGFWQYIGADNKIHPSFDIGSTVTGRTSSRDPNGQNIPKRGELAMNYRKVFIAPEGFSLIEVDLSQAEVRIAAWMANETEMLRIYREGGDIHAATASAVMGISEEKFNIGIKCDIPLIEVYKDWVGAESYLSKLSPDERKKITVAKYLGFKRFQAKAVVFGFLYGMGWRKFKEYAKTDYGIEYTDFEAEQARLLFFKKYPALERWHKMMRDFVKRHGYVRALHGALRRLPNIHSDDEGIVGSAQRMAINSPVQRFASDLGIMAMSRFMRDCPPDLAQIILFIHDALVAQARDEDAEAVASYLVHYMQSNPLMEWFGLQAPLPIVADASIGKNLGTMEERHDIKATVPDWFRAGEQCPEWMDSSTWNMMLNEKLIITG